MSISGVAYPIISNPLQIDKPANDVIDSSVKVLTTNEKGWFGAIIEYIRYCFGSVTAGSVTDLRLSRDNLRLNINIFFHAAMEESRVSAKKELSAFSLEGGNGSTAYEASLKTFYESLKKRAEKLDLKLDQATTASVASKIIRDTFPEKIKDPEAENFVNVFVDHIQSYGNPVQVAENVVVGTPVDTSNASSPKTWTRRTLEVVSVAALLAAVAVGGAYWAGRDVSVLTDNSVTRSVVKSAEDVKNFMTSYLPALPAMPLSLRDLWNCSGAPVASNVSANQTKKMPGNT